GRIGPLREASHDAIRAIREIRGSYLVEPPLARRLGGWIAFRVFRVFRGSRSQSIPRVIHKIWGVEPDLSLDVVSNRRLSSESRNHASVRDSVTVTSSNIRALP